MLNVDDNDDVNWKGFACDIDNEEWCSYDGDFEKTIVFTTFDDIDKETQPLGSKPIVFELLTSCQQDSSRKKTEIMTSSTHWSYHTSRNKNTNWMIEKIKPW